MLRSAWQKHRRVAYVVSGSTRRMMTDLVASNRSPFFGHFALLEIDAFTDRDAIALLVDGSVPGHPSRISSPRERWPPSAAIRSTSSSYLARLGDIIRARDDGHYQLTDPVMAMWLKWRAPGGAAVPMTVSGDDGARDVARALAELGFELVYQSKASRGAFDLLAIRGGVMVGVQVKRSAPPLHFTAAAWKRMEAESRRLGWLWVVAAASPDSTVAFLDPARARRRTGVNLAGTAAIANLLVWVDQAAAPRRGR